MLGLSGCFTERQNEGATALRRPTAPAATATRARACERLIPPVAATDYVAQHRAELPCLVRKGMNGAVVVNGVEYNQVMPGHEDLTDSQITNLLNFVQRSWGNQNQPYTIREASELLRPLQRLGRPVAAPRGGGDIVGFRSGLRHFPSRKAKLPAALFPHLTTSE